MPPRSQQSVRGWTACLSPLSSPPPASSCSRPRQWKRALKAVCSCSLAAPRTCRRGSKHYAEPSNGVTAYSEKPSRSSSAGWRSSPADALWKEWRRSAIPGRTSTSMYSTESRFVMLETIREFGLEHLGASKEESATRRAHAAYCVVLAEEYASQAADPANSAWIGLFEVEYNNFRTALEWLTQTG